MNYFKIWPNLDTTIREWVKQLNRLIENGNFQNVNLSESGSFYFGDKNTDGTWRITRDGNNLIHQRRELGAWVTKNTIIPYFGDENNAAPRVTANETMPIFELDPLKFTIDNAFTFWDRVLIQPSQVIEYVDLGGNALLTTDSITFTFDTTISIDISPVSVPLYSNHNNPSITIT